MSKRKAEVNDIVLEIDSDDLESSSSEEEIEVVKNDPTPKAKKKCVQETEKVIEIVDIDSSGDDIVECSNDQECDENGDKSSESEPSVDHDIDAHDAVSSKPLVVNDSVYSEKCFPDDIVVDSSSSSSESSSSLIIGCENKQPIISVRFRDNRIAKNFKSKIKKFMLDMIRIHDEANLTGSETDTDLELDIWPEEQESNENNKENDLFFIDDCPNDEDQHVVPQYSQNSSILTSTSDSIPTTPTANIRKGPICFNCEGDHALKDCKKSKNPIKIAENRKAMQMHVKVGRYHLEDEQRMGHMIPGRISGALRYALSLKREDVPIFTYRMRMMGYPPGWFDDAKIAFSGITLFDSSGKPAVDPQVEDGEMIEKDKDQYDIKKIIDYPGFNVPLSSRYKERGEQYGFPPMSPLDSKLNFLKVITPNAMLAYKRKKLTLFPSGSPNQSVEGEGEMELDDGEEVAEFPTLPPLPDDVLELPPPPPPLPEEESNMLGIQPPPPLPEESNNLDTQPPPPLPEEGSYKSQSDKETAEEADNTNNTDSNDNDNKDEDNCEVKNINEDDDKNSQDDSSSPPSPSLADLEQKRKAIIDSLSDDTNSQCDDTPSKTTDLDPNNVTPQNSKGHVKSTLFGTPMFNSASKYKSLPSDDKFSKDISDIINFENLPNSTGKYEKICNLLKKVKSEVDRIHET